KNSFVNGFKEFEVQPTSNWNYALVVDRSNPSANIQVNTAEMPENPFIQSTTPVTLTADVKTLSTWGLVHNGVMANDPDYGPVQSSAATQNVTLVPFGAENIRVTTFPIIGTPNKITTSFQDDFSSGTQIGWINYGGSFYVNNGEYIATNPEGKPESKSIQTATSFTDFNYDVKVQVGTSGNAGIVFRTGKTEFIPDGYNGYYFGISAGSSNQLELGKANGGWTSLKTANFNITANTWYQIRVVAQGTNIKIYVNDMTTPKINFTDASFSSGSIGVRNYNAVSKWDDIKVTDFSIDAVSDVNLSDKVKIFPNPAKDFVDVTLVDGKFKNCKIDIFNANGSLEKSVDKKEGLANVRIDTKGMHAGVHFLKIAFDSANYNSKFIIL
ncbi:MAG: family 16 glycoside hydrolase, partial [Paludibacter sp.]